MVDHPLGTNQNLVFLNLAAKDCNLSHTARSHQSRTYSPVGNGAQVTQ